MNNASVLVIDDEIPIRKLLEITLEAHEFDVRQAATGKEGLVAAAMHPPDLILLDLGLPDQDGQTVLSKLREWFRNPVVILSARNTETDIVKALDNGANDYLVKPFRTGELLARIRSALRSVRREEQGTPIRNYGNLLLDFADRTVKKNGEIIKLTGTEYALLALLAQNEGKVMTHQYILKTIWGLAFTAQSQYLRVYIGQLRKKIEDNPNQPQFILTESGVGYRFMGPT